MKRFLSALLLPALLFIAVAARALEPPDVKPGLWQTSIKHTADNPASAAPGTFSRCLDAKTIAASKQKAMDYAAKNCSKNETRQVGAHWVTDMVCRLGGKATMSTHSVTTFSGENAYHTEMTTTFEPPEAGQAHSGTIIDGKWLGACKGT